MMKWLLISSWFLSCLSCASCITTTPTKQAVVEITSLKVNLHLSNEIMDKQTFACVLDTEKYELNCLPFSIIKEAYNKQ